MLTQPATRMLATLLLALALPAGTRAEEPNPQVKVITNLGEFVIEVRQDRAPLTAANFLRYAREGFYSGTLIHRVVANFVIQGGGHDATTYALKTPHENVENRSSKPGEAAGCVSPHTKVCIPPIDVPTRWGYAVFGRILQGMDVIERIGEVATGSFGPFKADAPLKPIVIEKMEILAPGATAVAPLVTPVTPPRQDTILSPK